jgi:8-demethyl-8-alpha-L-rhamnosyltetracenomycin-C 2'-O-methyltransferase
MRTPLCELALKHGTDKAGYHEYTRVYYEILKDFKPKVVLEIGIGHPGSVRMVDGYKAGASLRMWEEFFPEGDIYGLDNLEFVLVNDRRVPILINEGRIHSLLADQRSAESLLSAVRKIGKSFDLIVDDGSHFPSDQILSVQTLIPFLAPGGIYIVEDAGEFVPQGLIDWKAPGFVSRVIPCPAESECRDNIVVIQRS